MKIYVIQYQEDNPDLTVVVFHSDKPGYFMAHWDFLADNARVAGMAPGPTGLHPYLDNFIRLSRLPVATISEIRSLEGRQFDPGVVRAFMELDPATLVEMPLDAPAL